MLQSHSGSPGVSRNHTHTKNLGPIEASSERFDLSTPPPPPLRELPSLLILLLFLASSSFSSSSSHRMHIESSASPTNSSLLINSLCYSYPESAQQPGPQLCLSLSQTQCNERSLTTAIVDPQTMYTCALAPVVI